MSDYIGGVKKFLEKLDGFRDRALFVVIKPFWPRDITPNHLTYLRIGISAALFAFLFYYHTTNAALVIALFFVGAATDMLDGSVARGLNEVTELGSMLDPLADRMLIIPIAVYSLMSSHPWLFSAIILLEILNAVASTYARRRGFPLTSNIFGKVKMVLQSVVFAAILVFWPQPPNLFFTDLLWLSVLFIIASIYVKMADVSKFSHAR